MSKQPNILFITTDEQHIDTIYRDDMPYELSNLKSLMSCSDVYTGVYSASPVCLPARCTWMTGMMPHRNGCISNNFGASLPFEFPNLFTCLRDAGYATSMHGKCHFAPVPYPAVRPRLTQDYTAYRNYYRSLGMDHLDLQDGNNVSMWYYDDYSIELEKQGLVAEYRNRIVTHQEKNKLPVFPHAAELHPDSWTGRKAVEYLDKVDPTRPNFMWVSFSGPHYPMDVPEEYMSRVDIDADIPRRYRDGEWNDETKHNRMGYFGTGGCTEGSGNAIDGAQKNFDEAYWRHWRQKYYANIVQIDDYIGKIITRAKEIFGDNLAIIFTTDHGDMMGNHSLWGKNCCVYDDVLRVPLIVHNPGQTARRNIDVRVSSTDVFPTILTLGGASIPSDIDGAYVCDIEARGGREYVISSTEGRVAVRKGDFKLCLNANGFEVSDSQSLFRELYDLKNDPYEYINLYNDESYAAVRNELTSILENESNLLRTVFYQKGDPAYWFNSGNGTGYCHNNL